jgi:hypothetical protein
MRVYLALWDSISIDDYARVSGRGAASQLARKLGLDLVDLTRDGNNHPRRARRSRFSTGESGRRARRGRLAIRRLRARTSG